MEKPGREKMIFMKIQGPGINQYLNCLHAQPYLYKICDDQVGPALGHRKFELSVGSKDAISNLLEWSKLPKCRKDDRIAASSL